MEGVSFRRMLSLLALAGAWGFAAAFTTPVRGLVVPLVARQGLFPSLVSLGASTYPDATTAYTNPDTESTIRDLLNLTNKERYRNGLAELAYNKELEKAAQRHAADMAKNNYFSHDGLNGSDLKDRVGLTDYSYSNVGENLFWRTPDNDPSYAVQGWMESPGHRKNMLDAQFSEIGLGYAVDEVNSKHYYVQVFGRPTGAGPPSTPPLVVQPIIDVGINGGPPPGLGPDATRDIIFRATNDARIRQGLPPFRMSEDLNWGAQEQADDSARSGKLTTQIKRGSYDRFFTQLGARFAAREAKNDPEAALEGWLTKGPQSDLLSERFSECGIGYATDGDQHYYIQLFGLPMETGVGRQDYTSNSVVPVVAQSVGSALGNGMPLPNNNNNKRKRSDRERNSDFGREGFGLKNADRRAEEQDELDDDWSDDRRVRARLAQRAMHRVQRPKSSEYRDSQVEKFSNDFQKQRDHQRRLRDGPGPEDYRDDYRFSSQPPPPARSRSSLTPSNGQQPKVRTAIGFDDSWNQDYVGTANTREYNVDTGGLARGPRKRNDYYDDYGPDYGYGGPPPRGGFDRRAMGNNGMGNSNGSTMRSGFDEQRRLVTGNNGRSNNDYNNNNRRGGMDDRRMDDRRMDDRRDQRGANRRYRGNTPSAFGKPPGSGSQGRSGSDEAVSGIHYQRHAQQQRMRDMPFDDGFDDGFYGPRDMGMMMDDPRFGRRGPSRRGGGYYGGGGPYDRRFDGPPYGDYYGGGPRGGRRPRGQGFVGPDNW